MSTCAEPRPRQANFELLVRSNKAWTSVGRFYTRRHAELRARKMGLPKTRFCVEDHRPATPRRRKPRREYFAVLRFRDWAILYAGTDSQRAAELLEPGTCFAKGTSRANARLAVHQVAARITGQRLDVQRQLNRQREREARAAAEEKVA